MKSVLYEKYHLNRKLQKKVINKNDFTYQVLVKYISEYCMGQKKVLDIGCGVGTIDLYLGSIGKKVLGVDISENAIKMATANAKMLDLEKKVIFKKIKLPIKYSIGLFDLVICSEVLEHIDNDFKLVSYINSILSAKGILIASSPSKNAPLYKMGLLKRFDREVGHLRRYTEVEFNRLFIQSGFKILKNEKTEGLLRNFLFTNKLGGQLLRILNKYPISKIVTYLDNLLIPIFGESNLYIVAQKI